MTITKRRMFAGLALGAALALAGSTLGTFAHENPGVHAYFGHMKRAEAHWSIDREAGPDEHLWFSAARTRGAFADAETNASAGASSADFLEGVARIEVCDSYGCSDSEWFVDPARPPTFSISDDLTAASFDGDLVNADTGEVCHFAVSWTTDEPLGAGTDHHSGVFPWHVSVAGSAHVSRPAPATANIACFPSATGVDGYGGITASFGSRDMSDLPS